MSTSYTEGKRLLNVTEKSPALVHADEFLAQVFYSYKWDYLFPCIFPPRIFLFRPCMIVEGLDEICEGDTETILYMERKTGSTVTIGMRKEPIIDFEFWSPNSIQIELNIHSKEIIKKYGLCRLLIPTTKVKEKEG